MMAVLIAGGRSRRMGCDKCLIEWRGKPLWQHQLETLADLQPSALAVAAPGKPDWLPDGVKWLPDVFPDSGPLAGILAALNFSGNGPVVALAVDLPRMTSDYLQGLLNDAGEHQGIVPLSAKGYEPLSAVYPVEAAMAAESRLQSGRRDLQGWVSELARCDLIRSRNVEANDTILFQNWNHPEDLKGEG